jgi:hypothetical protein
MGEMDMVNVYIWINWRYCAHRVVATISVSNEISYIGFDDGILVCTLCASLAIVGNVCSLKILSENSNLYLNYFNVFVVNS